MHPAIMPERWYCQDAPGCERAVSKSLIDRRWKTGSADHKPALGHENCCS